mmetsp:Transcript_66782/g.204412  ORF Transcript_66782/g.204412 Transcript_66782/m.204412 type:complete len:208 (-) Transcript_66782:28-651(-)
MSFFLPLLRTQRFAWPWGSIMSGHLLPRVTMMPFSMERSSEGKLSMFHSRISAGSTRTLATFQPGSVSRPRPTACLTHFVTRSLRNSDVNAPVYAMKPPQRTTLPTTNCRSFSSTLLAAVHRTLSFPRPASSFSARFSLTTQSSASRSSWTAFVCALCSCHSSAATLSRTTFSSACLVANFALASSLAFSAALSFSFLGSISRETLP